MNPLDRRRFLGTSAAAAAGASLLTQVRGEEAAPAQSPTGDTPPPPPMIELGGTGITMTRLGQGTGVFGGNRQSNQTRRGFEHLVELFLHCYERGIRFFDLADLYGTHIYFREALRTIPRDEITILTKVWWRYDGDDSKTGEAHRAQIVRSTIERFCHELTTDRIDIVLLHCLMDGEWPGKMQPYTEVLDAEKAAGRVKAVGVSCHDFGALKAAAKLPWVDVILARINPKAVKMDASTDEVVAVLGEAKQAGKAIIGMKIFGEGQLIAERDECMKFAQGLDFLDAMTIGFEEQAHVDDTLRLMAKYPVGT